MKQYNKIITQELSSEPDYVAPDGSRIFRLPDMKGGGICICELPAMATSHAVCHKTIEEIWFFLSGEGEVWRKLGDQEEITKVSNGLSLTIPLGCHFQFKNTGNEPLRFLIVTMPPWPGADEAFFVKGYW
jgi:mannose-6-phosphate isomerase-like protein (cupin superfamily)